MEAYQGKNIAGTDWTSYTLPIKELVDAYPDSGFDISNLWRVYVTGIKKPETISFRNMKLTSPDDERQYPFIKVNQTGYSVNGAKTAPIMSRIEENSMRGDVNADGTVNAEDARILRDYLIGKTVVLNAENADINSDGQLDARDLSLLKQKLLSQQ